MDVPMNPVSLRRAGILALSLALVALWVIALLSQRNWREFQQSTRQAALTGEVLSLNTGILDHIRNAETAQRGYLLTGEPSYLVPYHAAASALPAEFEKLIRVTAPGSVQRHRVEMLRQAADEKLKELSYTISLRRTEGLDAALKTVETGRGRALMDRIRGLSDAIQNQENLAWNASSQAVRTHADQARRLTITGVVILGFLLTAAFVANQSSARAREKLIAQLAEANRSATEVRDLLRTTFYSIADAVITMDHHGRVRLMNSVAERLTGMREEHARGKPIETVFQMVAADATSASAADIPARKALAEGEPQTPSGELSVVSAAGVKTLIDVSAAPIRDAGGTLQGCVLVFRDVGERKRQEEKLRETAKLESLGVLAGGIAHDFNNLLVGIIGNASLLRDELAGNERALRLLESVEQAGERAAALTRQMLAYSGRGRFLIQRLDLPNEVKQIAELIRASIPRNVELRLSPAKGLPPVDADSSQIQQLIMNLVINAAEAVAPNPGWVEVQTYAQQFDDRGPGAGDLPPGRYVVLRVADNGSGMDEATRARIFDPFFTTKFTGRGLGLAAVQGIVRGHRGAIIVDSTPGNGTVFCVYLPAANAHDENLEDAGQPSGGTGAVR
jgi:PAS domain S-box-containing protein